MYKTLCLLLLTIFLFSCATNTRTVSSEVTDPQATVAEPSFNVAAFVDTYPQGPINTPTLITSLDQFESTFGAIDPTPRADNHANLQVRQFFLNGGTNLWINRVVAPDYIGSKESKTGIYAFDKNFNILAIPVLASLKEPEAGNLRKAALELVKEKRAFLIIDPPATANPEVLLTWRNSAPELLNQDHAAIYFPRILVNDPALGKKGRYLEPSGTMAGIMSHTDYSQSPANIKIQGGKALEYKITDSMLTEMSKPANGVAINALKDFPNQGMLVRGAYTLNANSDDFRYIRTRRILLSIEQSVKQIVRSYVFQPNTNSTWLSVQSEISNYLIGMWKEGVIQGSATDQAFSVSVGLGTTMTGEDILNGLMNITVRVAVNNPNEFVVLTFQQQMPQ